MKRAINGFTQNARISLHVCSNNYRIIFFLIFVECVYCRRVYKQRAVCYEEIKPQPLCKDMLIIRRYYVTHKTSDVSRRITMIDQIPSHQHHNSHVTARAVVEYEGVITNIEPHGNAKRCNAPYIRTHPATIGKIEDQLRERKRPRDIYISMLENDDVHKTAKRLRQVHNIKQRITKEENGNQASKSFADEVQQVLTMLAESDSLVQQVFYGKNKVPSFILYSSWNMDH